MTALARTNPLSRVYSRFMFGLCIAFTAMILLVLALVIGYLVSIGWKSVSGWKCSLTLLPPMATLRRSRTVRQKKRAGESQSSSAAS